MTGTSRDVKFNTIPLRDGYEPSYYAILFSNPYTL